MNDDKKQVVRIPSALLDRLAKVSPDFCRSIEARVAWAIDQTCQRANRRRRRARRENNGNEQA